MSILLAVLSASTTPSMETAEAKVTVEVDKPKSQLILSLKTPKGTKLNYEAPWSLQVTSQSKKIKKFSQKAFKTPSASRSAKNLYTHSLSLPKASLGKKVDLELRYFICDDATSWCKPVTYKSSLQL